jgi:hypothetical protein
MNRYVLMVSGASATGKTASLRDLANPEGVVLLNTEAGKELPFPSVFKKANITDAVEIPTIIAEAESHDDVHTIVIDSLTYMMDLFESLRVTHPTVNDSRAAWGQYAQFFKNLMQQTVAQSTKNIIFTAHTSSVYDANELVTETRVKVKGSLMNQGIESYFNHVISTKKMSLKKLEGYQNDLLTVTPQEEALGFKYVYQTMLTRDTVDERIRGPMGMWTPEETYIDNNLQLVIDRLHSYYQ